MHVGQMLKQAQAEKVAWGIIGWSFAFVIILFAAAKGWF